MKLAQKAAFLAVAAAGFYSSAWADDTTLTETAKPAIRTYAGHAVDVIGISPGMTVAAVTALIQKKDNFAPAATTGNIGLTYKSISMGSQSYTTELEASAPNDDLHVFFGTPSTGNTVVGIDRTITFPDAETAPVLTELEQQVENKYGLQSSSKRNEGYPSLQENWVFNSQSLQGCQNSFCPAATAQFDPSQMQSYADSTQIGIVLNIEAKFYVSSSDPSRAASLEITIDDEGNKFLTANEAVKQLTAAGEAAYNKEATPQQGPSL